MNENDIIKLLKVCSTASGCKSCRFADSTDCAGEVSAVALALINRQKAEIDRLMKYNTDIARKHYSDGAKDLTEKLKTKAYPFPCAIGVEYAVTIRAINDTLAEILVKEMTEEAP